MMTSREKNRWLKAFEAYTAAYGAALQRAAARDRARTSRRERPFPEELALAKSMNIKGL